MAEADAAAPIPDTEDVPPKGGLLEGGQGVELAGAAAGGERTKGFERVVVGHGEVGGR